MHPLEVGEEEKEIIADLYETNCKVGEILRVVKREFDKNLSMQKICNLIHKITPAEDEDALILQNFLERIKEGRFR